MDKCLHCNGPISHITGKRKKLFCSNGCRSRHWAKKEVVPDSWQEKYYNLKELYAPLFARAASLENENMMLKAKIIVLEPSAALWQQKINELGKAALTTPEQPLTTSAHELTIDALIKNIKAEKIPKERDTPIGRKAWQLEQDKRIAELQKKKQ